MQVLKIPKKSNLNLIRGKQQHPNFTREAIEKDKSSRNRTCGYKQTSPRNLDQHDVTDVQKTQKELTCNQSYKIENTD